MRRRITGAVLLALLWPGTVFSETTRWAEYVQAGVTAYQQGRYAEAERALQAALEEAEGFKPEDPRLSMSLSNLAVLYEAQGRYADAARLSRRVLAIDEKVFGPEHAVVAEDLHNLAALYHAQRKYADAEPLYRRALVTWEKARGPAHPNVATSLENLAALLLKTNRASEAAEVWARATAIRATHATESPASKGSTE